MLSASCLSLLFDSSWWQRAALTVNSKDYFMIDIVLTGYILNHGPVGQSRCCTVSNRCRYSNYSSCGSSGTCGKSWKGERTFEPAWSKMCLTLQHIPGAGIEGRFSSVLLSEAFLSVLSPKEHHLAFLWRPLWAHVHTGLEPPLNMPSHDSTRAQICQTQYNHVNWYKDEFPGREFLISSRTCWLMLYKLKVRSCQRWRSLNWLWGEILHLNNRSRMGA